MTQTSMQQLFQINSSPRPSASDPPHSPSAASSILIDESTDMRFGVFTPTTASLATLGFAPPTRTACSPVRGSNALMPAQPPGSARGGGGDRLYLDRDAATPVAFPAVVSEHGSGSPMIVRLQLPPSSSSPVQQQQQSPFPKGSNNKSKGDGTSSPIPLLPPPPPCAAGELACTLDPCGSPTMGFATPTPAFAAAAQASSVHASCGLPHSSSAIALSVPSIRSTHSWAAHHGEDATTTVTRMTGSRQNQQHHNASFRDSDFGAHDIGDGVCPQSRSASAVPFQPPLYGVDVGYPTANNGATAARGGGAGGGPLVLLPPPAQAESHAVTTASQLHLLLGAGSPLLGRGRFGSVSVHPLSSPPISNVQLPPGGGKSPRTPHHPGFDRRTPSPPGADENSTPSAGPSPYIGAAPPTHLHRACEPGIAAMFQTYATQNEYDLIDLVAVKTVPIVSDMTARSARREAAFALRAQEAARRNPAVWAHIVRVLDFSHDELESSLSIAMELMSAGSVATHAAFRSPAVQRSTDVIPDPIDEFSEGERRSREQRLVRIARDVLRGLATLESELRVIHRDLKPENILLGADGTAKLADFGVAAVLNESGPFEAEDQEGSILYMSPERLRGEAHSFNSDVWSLGVTLLQLALSGRHPFLRHAGSNNSGGLSQQQQQDDKAPTLDECEMATNALVDTALRQAGLSNEFNDFVKRCLAVRRTRRLGASSLLMHSWLDAHRVEMYDKRM